MKDVVNLAIGGKHTAALRGDGTVVAIGSNENRYVRRPNQRQG